MVVSAVFYYHWLSLLETSLFSLHLVPEQLAPALLPPVLLRSAGHSPGAWDRGSQCNSVSIINFISVCLQAISLDQYILYPWLSNH